MSQSLTDDKSTLVQVMDWCRQATSHYLNRCWPRPMSPYGFTRPQWVKWISEQVTSHHLNQWWSSLLMCTFLFQCGVLWDMEQVHCGICETASLNKTSNQVTQTIDFPYITQSHKMQYWSKYDNKKVQLCSNFELMRHNIPYLTPPWEQGRVKTRVHYLNFLYGAVLNVS